MYTFIFIIFTFSSFYRDPDFKYTQSFGSQNLNTQSSQFSEPDLNEAFKEEFDVNDEPVYTANTTPFEEFLEYCSLSASKVDTNSEEEPSEGGVRQIY